MYARGYDVMVSIPSLTRGHLADQPERVRREVNPSRLDLSLLPSLLGRVWVHLSGAQATAIDHCGGESVDEERVRFPIAPAHLKGS